MLSYVIIIIIIIIIISKIWILPAAIIEKREGNLILLPLLDLNGFL